MRSIKYRLYVNTTSGRCKVKVRRAGCLWLEVHDGTFWDIDSAREWVTAYGKNRVSRWEIKEEGEIHE